MKFLDRCHQGSTSLIRFRGFYIFGIVFLIALSKDRWTKEDKKKMPYIWFSNWKGITALFIGRLAIGGRKL